MLTNLCSNEEAALRYLTVTGHTKTLQRLQERGFRNQQVQQELARMRNEEIKKMVKDDENNTNNQDQNQDNTKKSKLRVLVPKARVVFGVCDPYGELEYGEVFFKPSLPEGDFFEFSNAEYVVVGRNPCYHPGDVRILKLARDKLR
jgi:regulator of nonsense transcripts 1